MSEAPDLLEPIIGFRLLRLESGGKLVSPFWGLPRQVFKRRNKAICRLRGRLSPARWFAYGRRHPKDDPVPSPQCGCGLYAYHTRERALEGQQTSGRPGKYVLAIARAQGTLEAYQDGFRAEELELVALAPIDPAWRGPEAQQAAARLGIAYHPSTIQLEDVASEYGEPLPERLRPDEKAPVNRGRALAFMRARYMFAVLLVTGPLLGLYLLTKSLAPALAGLVGLGFWLVPALISQWWNAQYQRVHETYEPE